MSVFRMVWVCDRSDYRACEMMKPSQLEGFISHY